jgi:rubrerythrin
MATAQYDKENTRRINLKLNNKTDAEIIKILEEQDNIQGYIKRLIKLDKEQRPKEYPPTRYNATTFGCGICGHELEKGTPHYCSYCGQAIDWSRAKKAGK